MNCGNDGVCNYVELVTSATSQYLWVIWGWCICHETSLEKIGTMTFWCVQQDSR